MSTPRNDDDIPRGDRREPGARAFDGSPRGGAAPADASRHGDGAFPASRDDVPSAGRRGEDPVRGPGDDRESPHSLRQDVVAREKEEFGGFKFGSAFFGWLTATGLTVLLTALAAAIGAGIGLSQTGSVDEATGAAAQNADAVGIVGIIVVAVVLLVSYFCGGYVAGRMARFSGLKQGLAVWIWAVVIAVVVAVVTAIAGSQWDILGSLNSFPRIPVTPETATTAGILTAVGAALVTLIGAILGGVAGMRYHRRIDRVGLGR